MNRDDDKTQTHVVLTKGTMVSHYRIVEKIGAGGMGEVYLAEDTELDRKVALKFLPSHLCQDDDCRARFKREAQAVAKLNHPNIVAIHEVSEFKHRPFFAMEHVEGLSLREVIKQGKSTIAQIIVLAKQLCEGLQEAHEAGIIHRDIKPSNIIIDRKNRPKLLDFGLATIKGADKLTKTGSTLGTAGYMSPEQAEGKEVDQRSDIFSLGVVLYELITGRRPFEGDTDAAVARAIISTTPEPIARYKSGATGELQQIVNKALTKDPSLRYQHADDMLSDLLRLTASIPAHRGLSRRSSRVIWAIATASTFEIWGSLLNGSRLIIAPPGALKLKALAETLANNNVSVLWLTAGLFHVMVDEQIKAFAGVRTVLAGGDVVSPNHVRRLLDAHPDLTFVNGYGPTEGTTFTCTHAVHHFSEVTGPVPIGRPISNTEVFIVDDKLRPVPFGTAGELLIGGDGVTRGYWNRPELTAASFIHNPFTELGGQRLYRTGDFVRLKSTGTLDFLGRKDRQVKVRGFRIELAEIEIILQDHDSVQSCVVDTSDSSKDSLTAFLVVRPESLMEPEELRRYLKTRLPSSMIPSRFILLDSIPLTQNGKVDRLALITLAEQRLSSSPRIDIPRTDTEKRLMPIWQKVLAIEQVFLDTDFFESGGHSILAAQLMLSTQNEFNRNDLTPAFLLEASTLGKMAAKLDRAPGNEYRWLVKMRDVPGIPLFLIHGVGGGLTEYSKLLQALRPEQPVFGLQGHRSTGQGIEHQTVTEIAKDYVSEIVSVHGTGPYQLMSFCAGGMIALEIAEQLEAMGKDVSMLTIVDLIAPHYRDSTEKPSDGRIRSAAQIFVRSGLISLMLRINSHATYKLRRARNRSLAFTAHLLSRMGMPIPQTYFLNYAIERYSKILLNSEPGSFSGHLTLFRSTDTRHMDRTLGWSEFRSGRIEVHDVPVSHHDLLSSDKGINQIVTVLSNHLA